ncbi:hypothetical protein EJ08DRAFT_695363 [Tothia fuscella]|uniref:Uncharacterized protein n=1 Tax=Tothia fuscella TaxID=1048955 RepID=A0A9P4U159_9PEZI|nr:hypothetical protein EJ08DRAFT_695363 [Tothia fuscella]
MKTSFILVGLVALVAAQKSGGTGGAKGGKPPGGGAPKSGGSGGIQALISCVSKCSSDNLGLDPAAIKGGGGLPANLPCADQLPAKGAAPSEDGLVKAVTCLCADAKVDATVKCASACGSIAASAPSLKTKYCADPKAAAASLAGLAAKFGGGAGAPPGGKGPGARRL